MIRSKLDCPVDNFLVALKGEKQCIFLYFVLDRDWAAVFGFGLNILYCGLIWQIYPDGIRISVDRLRRPAQGVHRRIPSQAEYGVGSRNVPRRAKELRMIEQRVDQEHLRVIWWDVDRHLSSERAQHLLIPEIKGHVLLGRIPAPISIEM